MRLLKNICGIFKPFLSGGVGVGSFSLSGGVGVGIIMLLMAACTADDSSPIAEQQEGAFTLSSSVDPFIGENGTRVNTEGNAFLGGDLIRMKIICPFVQETQLRESTYGNSYDGFWLLKWTGSGWGQVLKTEYHFDIDGDNYESNAPYIIGQTMGQQTPYVFTASTWSDEVRFVEKGSKTPVVCFSNVFHADQRNAADYHASDVLWAQQFMETACWNVHLTFKHKMAALKITIDDTAAPVTDFNATTLTMEGMPDIDKQEIIIGDYYAAQSKVNSKFGYKEKNRCSYEENGKVLGIGVYKKKTEAQEGQPAEDGKAYCKPFSAITETCTYYAHYVSGENSKVFQMIVPPIGLPSGATLWFRNGEKRFMCTLTAPATFESGVMYNVKMVLTNN